MASGVNANPTLSPPVTAPSSLSGSIGGSSGGAGGLFSNPKADIAMAGLALDAFRGNSLGPYANTLSGIAGRENAQAAQLESSLESGVLPPGLQSGLTAATESTKAAIRAQ